MKLTLGKEKYISDFYGFEFPSVLEFQCVFVFIMCKTVRFVLYSYLCPIID